MNVSAAVPANPKQYISGEQQHHRVPGVHRRDLRHDEPGRRGLRLQPAVHGKLYHVDIVDIQLSMR